MRSRYPTLLFAACAGNLESPIVAVFLPLLAYRLGASVFEVGLVGGLSFVTYSFMPPILGHFSDRSRHRGVLLVLALAVVFPCFLLYGFASSPVELIPLRLVEGTAWALFWPTVDVMVGEEPSMESSKSFNVYNITGASVSAIAPFLGSILVLVANLRLVFVAMAALVAVTALLWGFVLRKDPVVARERPAGPVKQHGDDDTPAVEIVEQTGSAYGIDVYMLAVILPNAIRGILFSFFPVFATERGLSVLAVGAVTVGFGTGRLCIYLLSTLDNFRGALLTEGRIRTNLVVGVLIAVAAGALPLLPGASVLTDFACFALTGVAGSVTMTIAQVELIAKAQPDKRGRGAGLYEASVGIGLGVAPILAGLAAAGSLSLPFVLGPVGCLMLLPVMALLFQRGARRRRPSQHSVSQDLRESPNQEKSQTSRRS